MEAINTLIRTKEALQARALQLDIDMESLEKELDYKASELKDCLKKIKELDDAIIILENGNHASKD